jgi:hypothetical protein
MHNYTLKTDRKFFFFYIINYNQIVQSHIFSYIYTQLYLENMFSNKNTLNLFTFDPTDFISVLAN